MYAPDNCLFPDINGDYTKYQAMLSCIEVLDPSCFYGRSLGFQVSVCNYLSINWIVKKNECSLTLQKSEVKVSQIFVNTWSLLYKVSVYSFRRQSDVYFALLE